MMTLDASLPSAFISLRALAAALGVSRKTVKRALDRAGVHPFVLCDARNGSLRYDRGEVEAWLRKQRKKE